MHNMTRNIAAAKESYLLGLQSIDDAAEAYVAEYGTTVADLLLLIRTNQSEWSGSPFSVANAWEHMIRKHALSKLTIASSMGLIDNTIRNTGEKS
jgi:hypothetical protein